MENTEEKKVQDKIENWDDDGDFDFSKTDGDGEDAVRKKQPSSELVFSDEEEEEDSEEEEDWDTMIDNDNTNSLASDNKTPSVTTVKDDDGSSSTVSNQFLKLRAVFSAEDDDEHDENMQASNFLLSAIKEGESKRASTKRIIAPGEILMEELPEEIRDLILKVETLQPKHGTDFKVEDIFQSTSVLEQIELSSENNNTESDNGNNKREYKKALRDLAVKCYEMADYTRAAKYHLDIFQQCKYFENKNEYMYMVEAIAKIRCCQGEFSKGKNELKTWIKYMRFKYKRLKRDIEKGITKDNLMRQMDRKNLLESVQSLEITLARFCLNAGWPGYASTILLRLAQSIEIDDVEDIDNVDGKLQVVHLWLAETFLQAGAPSRALIILNRIKYMETKLEEKVKKEFLHKSDLEKNMNEVSMKKKKNRKGFGSAGRLINSFFRNLFEPLDPPVYEWLKAKYELERKCVDNALNVFIQWHKRERAHGNNTKLQQAKNYEFEGDIYEHATRLGNVNVEFPIIMNIVLSKEEDKREQIVLNNISDSVKHCVKAYRKAFDIYSSIGDHVGATRMALEIASVQTHVLIRDYFHEAPVDILFSGCNNNSTKDNEENNNNTLHKRSNSKVPICLLEKTVDGDVQNRRIAYKFSDLEHPATFAYSRTRTMGIPIDHINSCLLMAELNYLKGNLKRCVMHWSEAIDLFVYLFVDGSNVPLLRTVNIKTANRLFGILSRAMLLHFALPRTKVNKYIYIFDLYIQSQREMLRRSQFSNASTSSSNANKNKNNDKVEIFDDNQENSYILSPLFTYNYKLVHNGKSTRVVKETMKDARTKWDSIVTGYDSDIVTCEFCSSCLYRIQLSAEGYSKKKSPKEIYGLIKRNLFDLAHTMQWRRTASIRGEQPQPNPVDMNFEAILSNIYDGNVDDANGIVDIENLLRLVYVINVENFIMIYSPQSGCRSIAMLTEVDPPKESIMQRKISVQVDMDMFENDDSIYNASPVKDDGSPQEEDGGIKNDFVISLMNDVPHENINYVGFPIETQKIVVNMVRKKSDAHQRDNSIQASKKRMSVVTKRDDSTSSRINLINAVDGLHFKKVASTIIENAEEYQKVHAIPIKGSTKDDIPTEHGQIGFFASLFTRRVVVPNELRSMRKHEAPLLFVSSPLLMFLPYEDQLIEMCDVTRSHSLIFPFKCKIENRKRVPDRSKKKMRKSSKKQQQQQQQQQAKGVEKGNGDAVENANKEVDESKINTSQPLAEVDMKVKSLHYGKSIKIPQFLSLAFKTRRPVLQQTNEKVRKNMLIRRLIYEINHRATELTGGHHHPMNPNPDDVDHLKFHEKRLFSSSTYFYNFINRRYAAHCDNVPFQTPLIKHGDYPRDTMFNNGMSIKKLFHFIHVQYRIKSASAALSWFENFSDNNGKKPIILVLTFADMVECSEILFHIIGFRPDICILFVPSVDFQLALTTFSNVFNWAKKASARDIIVFKNAMKKPKQNSKGEPKPYLGNKEGPLNKQDAEFNLPEEWRTIRSIILSTTRLLRVEHDANVAVLNLPY